MNLKDLLPFYSQMVDSIWLLWVIHTTVAVAVVGWLISQRKTPFGKQLKVISSIGYSIFYFIICFSFYRAYNDLRLLHIDLKYLSDVKAESYPEKGYIATKLLDVDSMYYFNHTVFSIFACGLFYGFILYLIWSKWLWVVPKTTEMAKNTSDEKRTNK